MLKKIKIDTLSISDINEKIKKRDLIYNSIEKILQFKVKKNIKLKNTKKGNIRLISNNPNIAQEILLRKFEIIEILQKNYPEEIKDLKIRVEKI
jgi:hypothetical protein